jgi:hypothetical protein
MARLIHPIPVYLRQIDRDETPEYDENLREPIGQVERELDPIRLMAQIKHEKQKDPISTSSGVVLESDGYLLFRTVDLRTAGVVIARGDRIVQMGDPPNDIETDYYILGFVPIVHLPRGRGSMMRKAMFEDREPSRRRGDL